LFTKPWNKPQNLCGFAVLLRYPRSVRVRPEVCGNTIALFHPSHALFLTLSSFSTVFVW